MYVRLLDMQLCPYPSTVENRQFSLLCETCLSLELAGQQKYLVNTTLSLKLGLLISIQQVIFKVIMILIGLEITVIHIFVLIEEFQILLEMPTILEPTLENGSTPLTNV
ncbi:hypothetical protein CIPAW_15G070300 [Carya illinoinensis]|uniref:Uncharacterized protein n=1 Tax=Carya illinoinensis TaxID=32201 RepID=A0A8T1NCC5_CARIL|nr:hypothetical protein CIPAW_15G070300 [Carya illinoinensis]